MYRQPIRTYRSSGHPCESHPNCCEESMVDRHHRKKTQAKTRVPQSYDEYLVNRSMKGKRYEYKEYI